MMALIERLNRSGHTIVIITHAMDVAAAYARRVILMRDGRIVGDGPTREIFSDARGIEALGLTPPPIVQLGIHLGVPALTLDELVSCLSRTAEPPNRRTPEPHA
jgi:energy-coupling factor transport system ATP-binding protein